MIGFRPFSLLLAGLAALIFTNPAIGQSPQDFSVVGKWLASNTGIGTLRIDFTQTRRLKAVKVPVSHDGTLWLDYANNRFRWQTGDPPQTIVVSLGPNILIIRTPMKRFEVRPMGSGGAPGMAALANGFPRTLDEFQQRYRLLEVRPDGNTRRILAQPIGEAGRGVDLMTFVVEASQFRLLGIEIDLEDGSSMQTVFRKVQTNPVLEPGLFQPPVDGYTETKF